MKCFSCSVRVVQDLGRLHEITTVVRNITFLRHFYTSHNSASLAFFRYVLQIQNVSKSTAWCETSSQTLLEKAYSALPDVLAEIPR